jgi:hypothetical protein
MECKFHVGQKVVCVNDNFELGFANQINIPEKGVVYTVRDIELATGVAGQKAIIVRLEEVVNPVLDWDNGRMEVGFFPSRFRPLITRKTDISVFTAMLTGQKVSVPA